jgi:hypothetical protein
MARTKSPKSSSRALPYAASKPKPTTKRSTTKEATTTKASTTKSAIKKPTLKKPKSKPDAAAIDAAKKKQERINDAVLESEFVARENPLPPTALGDLSNDILPVFRAANFPDVRTYTFIEPSVRLASLLLKHPSLQPMLRTIVSHGALINVGETNKDGDMMYRYPRDTRPVTAADITLIDRALSDLAGFVTFRSDPEKDAANAATTPISRKDETKTGFRTRTLRGLRSRIDYSADLQQTLVRVTTDIPLLLARRFTFAVQLAHEVCHALINAKDGHRSWLDVEPFFDGAVTAEVGMTLEETFFGGSPSILWGDEKHTDRHALKAYYKSQGRLSNLVGLSVIWPLPCTWTVREYQHKDLGLWMRKADMDALKPKDIAWRVPLTEMVRFFDTAFWIQENPPTQLERTVGFAFSSDENGVKSSARVSKKELRDYAPEGYTVSKHMAIVEK